MMFRLKKSELAELEEAYRGYVKNFYQMQNGWYVLMLVNHVAVLFDIRMRQRLIASPVTKVVETRDGKFMLVKSNKKKAVYSAKGNMLANYDERTNLFCNGWFTRPDGDFVSLFDEKEELICSNVTKAKVFNDGKYFISVLSGGDANKVGFFNNDGTLIHFTNDRSFKRFCSSLFIADGSLYDVNGECLIESNMGSSFNRCMVRLIKSAVFWKN